MGFPHRNHGLDRLLATRLKVALPNKQIEVINTAMTAVNSRDLRRCEGHSGIAGSVRGDFVG